MPFSRHANPETRKFIDRGLSLLEEIRDDTERARLELSLLTTLGRFLISTQGNASPEVERVYRRAHSLCLQLQEPNELFPVLFGLRSFYITCGQLEEVHDLAKKLLELANETQDDNFIIEAHVALASTHHFLGHIQSRHDHAVAGFKLYDAERHKNHASIYGTDPSLFCQVRAAQEKWLLGYPEQSLETILEAQQFAQDLDPNSLEFAIQNATQI